MLREKECIWLRRLEQAAAKESARLTKWEREFLDKLLTRFRIQRATMYVSAGQWRVIAEIGDKIIH